jgi:hypothetical protein
MAGTVNREAVATPGLPVGTRPAIGTGRLRSAFDRDQAGAQQATSRQSHLPTPSASIRLSTYVELSQSVLPSNVRTITFFVNYILSISPMAPGFAQLRATGDVRQGGGKHCLRRAMFSSDGGDDIGSIEATDPALARRRPTTRKGREVSTDRPDRS